MAAPARLDLATGTRRLPDHGKVADSVRVAAERLLDLQRRQPWGQPYGGRLALGSNGRILNNLVVLAEPTSETTNDICIRWNAPLTYITTYLSLRTANFDARRIPPAPNTGTVGSSTRGEPP